MNNRGQNVMIGLGTFLMMFVVIIVGIALFVVIAQQVGSVTSTGVLTNYNVTPVASTTIWITDYKSWAGTVTVTNNTGDLLNSGNYTIVNGGLDGDGAFAVNFSIDADAAVGADSVWTVNSSVTQTPEYISDSASRSIISIITIFFALAIAVVAMVPTFRGGLMDMIGK